jgi:predicted enzyme related to lactoylglutathione lyase
MGSDMVVPLQADLKEVVHLRGNEKGRRRMPVLGIGGLFFRARDPDALSAWYKNHLGVGAGCNSAGGETSEWFWHIQGGPVVFQPFKQSSDYFAADKAFMLNLRVSGLDELLDRLRAAGVEVITKAEWDAPETGRFARIHDPEGNAIELWEPPAGM